MTKTAIITGASSGMGHATALYLQKAGYQVYAGTRRVERMHDLATAGVDVQALDVTDAASNQSFVEHVLRTAGRIDVLINNAGYGSFGRLRMSQQKRPSGSLRSTYSAR